MGLMDTMKGMFGHKKEGRGGVEIKHETTTPEQYQADVLGANADAEVAANKAHIEANEREVNAAIDAGDMAKAGNLIADLQAGRYAEAGASTDDTKDEEVA